MIKLTVFQIGAGGTGSWFGRTLAQMLCQWNDTHKGLLKIVWTVMDYDVIEKRNLLRQPFLGGIGVNKASYLARNINDLFNITEVDGSVSGSEKMARGGGLEEWLYQVCRGDADLKVIVSCVDNTYTREVIEKYLFSMREAPAGIWYVNMGVSPDGDWYVERLSRDALIPTKWDEISYPDAMLSCGQRAETTPVPQTTYSNMQAGAMAAHMVSKLLYGTFAGEEVPEILCIAGKDFTVRDVTDEYVPSHMMDVVQSNENKEGNEDENSNMDEGFDLGSLGEEGGDLGTDRLPQD